MDQQTFAIIITLTTVISYLFIRRYFYISRKYVIYGAIGIIVGLTLGSAIAWPFAAWLGNFGIVIAPYLLGLVLLFFIEAFIIEGPEIIRSLKTIEKKEMDLWDQHKQIIAAKKITSQDIH